MQGALSYLFVDPPKTASDKDHEALFDRTAWASQLREHAVRADRGHRSWSGGQPRGLGLSISRSARQLQSAGAGRDQRRRVRFRSTGEKISEWAIPDDAIMVCAGPARLDLHLHGVELGRKRSTNSFRGMKNEGGGFVPVAVRTLARLSHGAPLGNDCMQVSPPAVSSVVPLCKVGDDDAGQILLGCMDRSSLCRNVNIKHAEEAMLRKRKGNQGEKVRTATAVLSARDNEGGIGLCYHDSGSNDTLDSNDLLDMMDGLMSPSGVHSSRAPPLEAVELSSEKMEDYHRCLTEDRPTFGAFLLGNLNLLPLLHGESLAKVLLRAREVLDPNVGVVALDLRSIPPAVGEELSQLVNDGLRPAVDLVDNPAIGPILPLTDILHLGEEALTALTGSQIWGTGLAGSENVAIAEAVDILLARGVAVVAVTGEKGGCHVHCNSSDRFVRSRGL